MMDNKGNKMTIVKQHLMFTRGIVKPVFYWIKFGQYSFMCSYPFDLCNVTSPFDEARGSKEMDLAMSEEMKALRKIENCDPLSRA